MIKSKAPQINIAFASPFLRANTDTPALAEKLNRYILQREDEKYRHPNSPQQAHRNVFESRFDFLQSQDVEIQEFRRLFYSVVGGFIKQINNFSDAEIGKLRFNNHCWYHVTRERGYFQPHNHSNASWSAIYCVNPGDKADEERDDRELGHLVFSDPRIGASMYMDRANRNMAREFSFHSIRFRLRAADMVVFPSYLQHWVEPYVGTEPRITIAANFWFHADA